MNHKNHFTSLLIIALIATITFAVAQTIISYWYPNTGTIIDHPAFTMYIEGVAWANNTAIDWGACDVSSTYLLELNVSNTGNTPLTVQLVTYGLPSTWTLAWAGNNTALAVGTSVKADLELTIPSGATDWPTWGFWINGI